MKTPLEAKVRVHPVHRVHYTQEFKDKAVQKILGNGRLLTQVAEEMGISKSVLSKWIKKNKEALARINGQAGEPERASRANLEERLARLEDSIQTLRKVLEKTLVEKMSL